MIPSSVADAESDACAGRGRRGVGGSAALHGRGVQERVPPTEPRRRPRAGQGGVSPFPLLSVSLLFSSSLSLSLAVNLPFLRVFFLVRLLCRLRFPIPRIIDIS